MTSTFSARSRRGGTVNAGNEGDGLREQRVQVDVCEALDVHITAASLSTITVTSVCSSKESAHQAALYDSKSIVETCGQSRTLKLFFGFFP